MDQKVIDKAVGCRTFAEFRRRYAKDYDRLVRLGQARELYDMFENDVIKSIRDENPPAPKVDGRRNREGKPRVHLEDIFKASKLYKTYAGFMKRGGAYAEAVRRRGLEEEVKSWFENEFHTKEILQESEAFTDWESFEIDRPRYAEAAVKHRVKDLIIREMEARNARSDH